MNTNLGMFTVHLEVDMPIVIYVILPNLAFF